MQHYIKLPSPLIIITILCYYNYTKTDNTTRSKFTARDVLLLSTCSSQYLFRTRKAHATVTDIDQLSIHGQQPTVNYQQLPVYKYTQMLETQQCKKWQQSIAHTNLTRQIQNIPTNNGTDWQLQSKSTQEFVPSKTLKAIAALWRHLIYSHKTSYSEKSRYLGCTAASKFGEL